VWRILEIHAAVLFKNTQTSPGRSRAARGEDVKKIRSCAVRVAGSVEVTTVLPPP